MNFASGTRTFQKFHFNATAVVLACVGACASAQQFVTPAPAQQQMLASVSESSSVSAALPDAPSSLLAPAESTSSSSYVVPALGQGAQASGRKVAPIHALNIYPNQQAQPLTASNKYVISIQEMYSLSSITGYVASAGYSDISNGSPNYGTDGTAFGKRVGAAALRGASEDILADGMLASAFHEDPRYYIEGDGHNFFNRLFYSATRPLVTQSDSGHKQVNASMLLGYLGASALTVAYYPQINRNATDVARTYGTSLGGAAVGFVVEEFIGDVVGVFHHGQQP